MPDLAHVISMLIYAAAGICLFLTLLNRAIILMPDGDIKNPTILGTFALLCGGGLALGYWLHRLGWIFMPITVLILASMSEIQRWVLRNRTKGTKPVAIDGPAVELHHPVTTTNLRILRYEVPQPKWHGPRMRIVHITDMHVTPDLPLEYYTQAMDSVSELEPDITLFTGDYITELDALPLLRQVLYPVGRYGSFASVGNHDYWAGIESVKQTIKSCGLALVENSSIEVMINDRTLTLSATDAPWGNHPVSVRSSVPEQLHIVLSHTADNIYTLNKHGADMVFTGHYHGGQFRIPHVGSIVIPSRFGRRFDQGHFVVHGTHLFVSAGLGSAAPPIRLYCPPDIIVVDVVAE